MRPRLLRLSAVAAALAALSLQSPASRAAGVDLFDDSAAQMSQAPPPDRAARRARYTTIDFGALPDHATPGRAPLHGAILSLPLFDDVTVRALFERFDPNNSGITWVGRIAGDPGSVVTLVYGGGLLTGSITTATSSYTIRPAPAVPGRTLAAGTHVVVEVDQTGLPPEAEPILVTVPAPADSFVGVPQEDSGAFIDVMVVYTPAAAAWAGGTAGMLNLINLGISETNTSYEVSGVVHRVRLAHAAEVPYAEPNDFGAALSDLQGGAGALSGVAALRDTYSADLVAMLVRPAAGNACGIGYLLGPNPGLAPFGFTVTDAICVSPNYSFAHELGHNMGANHDWFVSSSTSPYTYAHGYVNAGGVGQRWRTIMAYDNLCAAQGFSCARLLRWANPEVTHNGLPTGVPARTASPCPTGVVGNTGCDADDRRTLNNTALTIANFRQLVPAGAPATFNKTSPSNGAASQPAALTLTWQAATGASSYEYCVDAIDDRACGGAWTSAGAAVSADVSSLATGTTYYWQVRAVNASGTREANAGAWWSFSTPGNAVYNATLKVPLCASVGSYCDSGALLRGRAAIGPEPNQPNTLGGACSDGTSGQFHVDESIDKLKVFTNDAAPFAVGKTVTVEATIWSFSPSDRLDIYATPATGTPSWSLVASLTPPGTGQRTMSTTYVLPAGVQQAVRAVLRYGGAASACGANSGYDDRDDLAFAVSVPYDTNILTNGTFASGTSGWLTFAQPSPAAFVFDVVSGVFQFHRPPGSTQGVVFQNTNVPVASGAPLRATLEMGNSSPSRRRFSVLIHDADFSDLHVCTFWLDPDVPPATYSMLTRTTKAWTNATISIYAASVGDDGSYLLDNVALTLEEPNATPDLDKVTECGDPAAPSAGGVTSAELLINGTFDGGTIAPWSTFGNIASQLASGVVEFFKLAGSPAGVLLQVTGEPMAADQRMTASFQLGNSSGVRQRVTVLLHKEDFADLHACTFWIPAGQPLSTYSIRTYATMAWAGATVSIYPATVGTAPTAQWLRVDDVTLTRSTTFTPGTACVEPGASGTGG